MGVIFKKHGLQFFPKSKYSEDALAIDSNDLDKYIKYIRENEYYYIALNDSWGLREKSLEFLDGLELKIKGLSFNTLDCRKFNLSHVNKFKNLKYLSLPDELNFELDLLSFPKLEELTFTYSKQIVNHNRLQSLKVLGIWSYKPQSNDLTSLSNSNELNEIILIQPSIDSLAGLEKFKELKVLNLYGIKKLEKLDSLGKINIKELEIENLKKIQDYTYLQKLKYLEKLIIINSAPIKTLSFLSKMNLKHFSFINTDIIDGDLSYCFGINFVGFIDKRHYSHKNSDFIAVKKDA